MRAPRFEITRTHLADLPGIVLSFVSAATVAHGAMLLRNQAPALMFALGAGVAASTFLLDKRLIERLNAVRPQQNLLLVLLCWLPLFTVATAFAAVTAFSAIAPVLGVQEEKQAHRAHWARETAKLTDYLGALQTALQEEVSSVNAEIASEQQNIATARAQKLPVSLDQLRAFRRQANAIAGLKNRAVATKLPPAEPPDDAKEALEQLGAAFQALRGLDADARTVLAVAPPVPVYELIAEPSTDLQSIVVRETLSLTAPAKLAWTTAGLIELLPLVALYRGGRKVPLALRLLEMRHRIVDVREVLRGRTPWVNVPMEVQPLNVRGVLRARLLPSSTVRHCLPRIEEAVAAIPLESGRPAIAGFETSDGSPVEEDKPLLEQLAGRPLVVRVEILR